MDETGVAGMLAEDARGTAKEVWLLDRGEFLVWDDVAPSWRTSARWRLRMRQRRVLRMFVPLTEIGKLKGVQLSFNVAKRGYEMIDALRRHIEWLDALDALLSSGADAGTVAAHRAKEASVLRVAVRTAEAHARVVERSVPERASPIRTLPFEPPPVVWDEDREAKAPAKEKQANAGRPGKAQRGHG